MPVTEIAVYSDVVCPWCWIGAARLDRALTTLGDAIEPALRWLPFELNPDMPEQGADRQSYLAAKFGGPERAQQMYQRIEDTARADGLEVNFAKIARTPNTFTAHRLIREAYEFQRGDALKRRLMRGYFRDGEDVGAPDVLRRAAQEIGMTASATDTVLNGDTHGEEVRALEAQAQRLGVTGVPFFILNRRYALPGAVPVEALVDALKQAMAAPAET